MKKKHTESNDKEKRQKNVKGITYDSIGGLSNELNRIRELFEIPLFNPERFTQFGLKPSRGILLYGPSGTGKSLIANAIAAESNVNFVTVNAHDILSTFYGESEEKLRDIFIKAQENAPSIIFIDDIDSLCPKREAGSGIDRRIVTTFLTLMDGGETNIDERYDLVFQISHAGLLF